MIPGRKSNCGNVEGTTVGNTKYTGKEMCSILNRDVLAVGKSIIANIGGHHIVCIKETEGIHGSFKVFDIWDSTNGCIGNYWVRQ